jgi:hypothetical protein
MMRWAITALAVLLAACGSSMNAPKGDAIVERVDHLMFAVADLNDGIAQIEAATGVRAQLGGSHPGRGSHNALLSLGPRVYLEIIAPDPQQAQPRSLESLGLSASRSSRLVSWALNAADFERLVADAGAKGYPMTAPANGERRQPDGHVLAWRTTALVDQRIGDGLVPFFIDWGATEHPAVTSPQGARLVSLRAQHPSSRSLQPIYDALGVPLQIENGSEPAMIAVLDTPRGRIELR